MNVVVEGEVGRISKPIPLPVLKLVSGLSGRKVWGADGVKFEATPNNVATLKSSGYAMTWEDKTGSLAALFELENMAAQLVEPPPYAGGYEPRRKLFDYQAKALGLGKDRAAYAYLLEMGLGKTAIAIANAGMLCVEGKVTGVLVLSPKGVHRQWIEEQVPAHIDSKLPWSGIVWKGKPPERKDLRREGLTIFSMNVDAIRTPKGFEAARDFLRAHRASSMMILDEAHSIKSFSAGRTRAAIKLGIEATYRRILTGTPIAKDIVDAFAQFFFLDPRILGHKYQASFKARYCVLGGWEGRAIIGTKNVEEFYGLIAPHAFRLTKTEALDLPPKVYVQRPYEMGEKTAKHYRELKRNFITKLDSGDIVDVPSAAVALVRLQQIVCGYLPGEEGGLVELSSERIDEMMEVVDQTNGPTVIWCRFIEDAKRIVAALSKDYGANSVALYRGADSVRAEAKRAFVSGERRFFVANPAAGGTGLDGLQNVCQTVIYYSNGFDALHRWQSEDRTHRIGTTGSVTYFDLVADKTVDKLILRNLAGKKSLSDMTLDQIRTALGDE